MQEDKFKAHSSCLEKGACDESGGLGALDVATQGLEQWSLQVVPKGWGRAAREGRNGGTEDAASPAPPLILSFLRGGTVGHPKSRLGKRALGG